MPFGLCNAPSTFQALMNEVLDGLLDTHVLVYLDDILVFSSSLDKHIRQVREVLRCLQDNHLYCALAKCSFHTEEVKYLGYLVSGAGIHMDPGKVKAITSWPMPSTVHDVQVFLGFTNFY